LVQNQGKVVSKERMLEEIWEGSFVEENNLAQNISALRRILKENKKTKFIETVPKFGYRFVADVIPTTDVETDIEEQTPARVFIEEIGVEEIGVRLLDAAPVASLSRPQPETRYVQNGDVNIAYQVVGTGDIDVVFVMGWVSHLEYFWKHPLFASFLD